MADSVSGVLLSQYQLAHGTLEGTIAGVTAEQAHWVPPGKAVPIAAHYAHVIASEDFFYNVLLQGGAPIGMSTLAERTGISAPPPPGDWSEWARTVRVDLAAARAYGAAVYAATERFLGTLTAEGLAREVDLSMIGLGTQTVGYVANALLMNAGWHCGEISCLKGLQGEKGYPI